MVKVSNGYGLGQGIRARNKAARTMGCEYRVVPGFTLQQESKIPQLTLNQQSKGPKKSTYLGSDLKQERKF